MALTVRLATESVAKGGDPFGTVIVKAGKVVASGASIVTLTNDPTAHAEIVAIRAACAALGAFQLDGCDVYRSCEPCPMCLGALYWARPRAVYYAADAGFDGRFIDEEIARHPRERALRMAPLPVEGATEPFERWEATGQRTEY